MLLEDLPLFALWSAIALLTIVPLLRPDQRPFPRFTCSPRTFNATFFCAFFLALLACRAPVLFFPHELNVDESQLAAQALGYTRTWVPFSQDSHTCGPLNYYVLMWPVAAGWPITYFTVRVTGLIVIIGTLFFAIKALSHIVGLRWSYLLTLPLISFFLFAYQPGFVHYASEPFPAALLAAAAWIIAALWKQKAAPMFTLGLLLSAAPFAKLQAAPSALYLFCIAAALLYFDAGLRTSDNRRPWNALVRLILGGATVPLLIGMALVATGTLSDTFYRYIIMNLGYNSELWVTTPHSLPYVIYEFARNGPQFTIYFIDLMLCAAIGIALLILNREKRISRSWLTGFILCLVYLVLTWYAVLKPGQAFCHYLQFLPVPTLLFLAWVARGYLLFCPRPFIRRHQRTTISLFIIISFFALPLYVFEQKAFPYLEENRSDQVDPVSVYIKSVTNPNDTMSNWGYTPKYYVETQIPPVVRDYSTLFEIFPDKRYDYFREGYLDDLKRKMPKIIVDSVAKHYLATWVHPLEKARATAYPPLAEFLAEHYQPAVAITPDPTKPPVLVYVRKP